MRGWTYGLPSIGVKTEYQKGATRALEPEIQHGDTAISYIPGI